MKLILGGFAQGKLRYVLKNHCVGDDYIIYDADLPDSLPQDDQNLIINHLHEWIKKSLAAGGCPEEELFASLSKYPNCIIICDEIGNGIVPIEPFEREYRERTGRILVELASQSETVERVVCGLGQKIK